ncbi:MAG TPA: hypothetical protein PJ997_02320 [Candidatus Paceibacterota bacterium]|nr:hypothetical protein [Candidatus Paceibacterota bacterium]HMP19149.1 hypothetical protein [Candidatus Paceibacterota bacterium]HMP85142.1 hypothetical protein [Candidatus Paceibacterota bacterium]
MFIRSGSNRFVIVCEDFVIKIAKIRFILATKIILDYISGKIQKTEAQKNKSLLRIFFGTALNGIVSNIVEYKYSISHQNDHRIFHTCFCFFGIFNIQERGSEIEFIESWPNWYKQIQNPKEIDLFLPKQFGLDMFEKIRIVDYGHKATITVLKSTMEKSYRQCG